MSNQLYEKYTLLNANSVDNITSENFNVQLTSLSKDDSRLSPVFKKKN